MFYENIIIGAGPAGLQAAYFFKKYNINYLVLEKNEICGSFFNHYPHSGKLISINKKYTGSDNKDFNLRHDWNSLLNDEQLLFTNYSDNYYPDSDKLVEYLNDFAKKNELNIKFNKQVLKIDKKEDNKFYISIKNSDEIYICDKLIIGTGLSKPNIPELELDIKDKINHYADFPKGYFLNKENLNEYKNKSVLFLGSGNASYELANILNDYTSNILILGKLPQRKYAITSHYSGDIRSVYLPFLDTFLLKSLNAYDYLEFPENEKLSISQKNNNDSYTITNCYYDTKNKYDKIIICSGWKFDTDIFNFDLDLTQKNKYPKIKINYESSNIDNLFFIGTLMHSLDFRKSSGGFIHGFRYLIENFVKMNFNIKYTYYNFNINELSKLKILCQYIIKRINTSSNIYQMFGTIGDIFVYNIKIKTVSYFTNIDININPTKFIDFEYDLIFILTLDYGYKPLEDLYKIGRKFSKVGTESDSSLLHPILKIYRNDFELIDMIHFDEDLFADFTNENKYFYKLLRTLKPYFL